MARLVFNREVTATELEGLLRDALGAGFGVTAQSESRLRVRKGKLISAPLELTPQGGSTVVHVGTSGLIISRIVQITTLHPSVKRALTSLGARA